MIGATLAALTVGGIGVLSASAQADHVTICHALGNGSFNQISPSASGVFNGHLGQSHMNGEDIIPPFQFDSPPGGPVETFSQNWDATGMAIFDNGCVVPNGGPPNGSTPPNGTAPKAPSGPSAPKPVTGVPRVTG